MSKKKSTQSPPEAEEVSLKYIKTTASVSLYLKVGDKRTNVTFTKTDDPVGYAEVSAMVDAADRDGLITRLTQGLAASTIPTFSRGEFEVDVARRAVRDLKTKTEVGESLARRIVEWHKQGLPFEPLLQFHRRVVLNPSQDSVKDLYSFLDANDIPITPDGRFIGYKKVTRKGGTLLDSHSRTIANQVGTTVSMPRGEVDPDRNNTCSSGLHVGAWQFVKSFTGDVIVEVLVDPVDVVAVPPDYNQQKMRVCRYAVVREMADGAEPHKGKMVKVDLRGYAMEGHVEEPPDFNAMTAREVKEWILAYDGTVIDTDNKNKRAIVKKAYAAFAGAHNE